MQKNESESLNHVNGMVIKSNSDSNEMLSDTDNAVNTEKTSLSVRVDDNFSEEYYSNIKDHFGTTNNFDVAGYMLKDGSMLDFSGRHWGDTTSKMRQVDHRDLLEVEDVFEEYDDGTDAMIAFINSGNIRLLPEEGGINLFSSPSKEQEKTLEKYINHFRGSITIDFDDESGKTVKTLSFNEGTSSSVILQSIDDYFNKGNTSELMDFHRNFSVQVPSYDFADDVYFTGTDEEIKAAEQKEEEIKDFFKGIIEDDEFLALRYYKDGYKNGNHEIILHHSTRPGIKYQLSFLDNDGPIMHQNYVEGQDDKLYTDLMNDTLFEKNRDIEVDTKKDAKALSVNVPALSVDTIGLEVWDEIMQEEELKTAQSIIEEGAKTLKDIALDEKKIDRIAANILKTNKSTYSKVDLSQSLKAIFAYMTDTADVNYDVLLQVMKDVAKPVLENSKSTNAAQTYDYERVK